MESAIGRAHRTPALLRAPFEGRTWREYVYLLLSLPMSILWFVYTVTTLALGGGLMITFLGVPVLAACLAGARGLGVVERARARALLGAEVAEPEPLQRRKRGFMGWVGSLLRSGTSWRHVLYALLSLPWSVFCFALVLPLWTSGWALVTYPLWRWVFPRYTGRPGIQLYGNGHGGGYFLSSDAQIAGTAGIGLVLVLVTPWIIRGLASVDRLMVEGMLGPSRLETRVTELESDRGTVVDTAAADLRRIERDLHDGAQARLVALAMDLGLAKEKLTEDPQAAARMVDEAHGEVKIALQELRDLARGIHPAILTDRGLGPALSAVATRCSAAVDVTVDLPTRPAAAIEGIAYFTACELLTNVSKHSGASRAAVDIWKAEDRILLQVGDNGGGGASADAGSGLAGLAERLDAVDGLLVVDSPAGGPTRITAELPWRG